MPVFFYVSLFQLLGQPGHPVNATPDLLDRPVFGRHGHHWGWPTEDEIDPAGLINQTIDHLEPGDPDATSVDEATKRDGVDNLPKASIHDGTVKEQTPAPGRTVWGTITSDSG